MIYTTSSFFCHDFHYYAIFHCDLHYVLLHNLCYHVISVTIHVTTVIPIKIYIALHYYTISITLKS